ncbi:uncharacterized protein [Acropora muricata]|uniref:uncharacterized protein n=1 Tax=Acropora muricata TaxID=159855 RepID=UPI0034E3AD24
MEAVLGDVTATIPLDLWESHIDKVQQGLVYTFTNLQVRVWSGKKKLSTAIRTVVQPVQDPALSQIPIDSTDKETEETLQVSDVHSVQKIEKYLKCKHCNKKILQGTCTDVIQCERCGFIMRATTCEKSVTAKIVVLLDEQQVSLKIDDTLLTKMFGDVISIDDKTLAQKLLFLEDFAVTYNTDTLVVSDINM